MDGGINKISDTRINVDKIKNTYTGTLKQYLSNKERRES